MKFQISDEIKDRTTECPSDFSCLTEDANPMCNIDIPMCNGDYISSENGLFIKPLSNDDCPYQMPFRSGFLCHCPTRLEIFKKYNV
jgi:hypothetical protein